MEIKVPDGKFCVINSYLVREYKHEIEAGDNIYSFSRHFVPNIKVILRIEEEKRVNFGASTPEFELIDIPVLPIQY